MTPTKKVGCFAAVLVLLVVAAALSLGLVASTDFTDFSADIEQAQALLGEDRALNLLTYTTTSYGGGRRALVVSWFPERGTPAREISQSTSRLCAKLATGAMQPRFQAVVALAIDAREAEAGPVRAGSWSVVSHCGAGDPPLETADYERLVRRGAERW